MSGRPTPTARQVAFHDAECGGYRADLPLWRRLADERGDPVLDLGCGSGRVAVDLASRGHRVVAIDHDRALLAALAERADGLSGTVEPVLADVRNLDLGDRGLPLAIAPMQLLHLLGGSGGRRRLLDRLRASLRPGGLLCAVLLDDRHPLGVGGAEPLPDVRELDGWVHSSLPLEVRSVPDGVEVVRLRQLVAPDGSLSEDRHSIMLEPLGPDGLEREAAAAGWQPAGREPIAPTAEHVGSLAVLLEVPGG